MNVCFLLSNWGTFSGSGTYHRALVDGLRKKGVGVSVVLPYRFEPWELPSDIDFYHGLRSESIKALQRSATWVVWGIGHKTSIPALISRKKTRPNIISINHGSGTNRWSMKCAEGEVDHSDVVVGVSQDSLAILQGNQQHKGVVIGGPVDRDRLAPTVDKEAMKRCLGIGKDDKVALYVGRIASVKKLDLAIEAMRHMPKNWRLLIVGDVVGDFDLKPLYGNFNIRFCGPTINPGDYLQVADCCVCPSPAETFGLSAAEAIVSGVPTVSRRVGFFKDMDVGTIVPDDVTPQVFAAAMVKAELDRGKAASDAEAISDKYTVQEFLEKWEAILW